MRDGTARVGCVRAGDADGRPGACAQERPHGGGRGAGKATLSEFTIEKAIDATTGKLLQTALTGAHLATVDIVLCSSPDCSPASQYATYKLTDVLITSLKQGVGTIGNLQTEQVGFSFAKLESSTGGSTTCFNIAANASC